MKKIPFVIFFLLSLSAQTQEYFKEDALNRGVKGITITNDFMGGGLAVIDFDNDGWLDIYFTGGLSRDRLYKNYGNGYFKDITEQAGGFLLTGVYKTNAVVVGDINNDGFDDIFVTTAKDVTNLLYINNGNGTFREVSVQAGFTSTKYCMGAVMSDFNNDGLLDIYTVNYVDIPRVRYDSEGSVIGFDHICHKNELYINNGDETFTEQAAIYGVDNSGCGLAAIATDLNNDSYPDLLIANDFGEWVLPNAAYQYNPVNNSFEDVSEQIGMNAAIYGMGIAVGDYNNDLMLDYYITNLGRNILLKNNGNGTFSDVTTQAGVEDSKIDGLNTVGWSTAFLDVDNNGIEDLYLVNGYVGAALFIQAAKNNYNRLFYNIGSSIFSDISIQEKMLDPDNCRGMAIADLNNDGVMDVIVNTISIAYQANQFRHKIFIGKSNDNNWLKLKLEGATVNKNAYGAKVILYANGQGFIKELNGGVGHGSQSTQYLHFGLNSANAIDSLLIYWPGSNVDRIYNLPINQTIYYKQSEPVFQVLGCMDSSADNFNVLSEKDYACYYPIEGCTNVEAINFSNEANKLDNSCLFNSLLSINDRDSRHSVYPNPAKHKITVKVGDNENWKFRLIDFNGKQLFVYNNSHEQNNVTNEIGLPLLKPGLYLYEIIVNADQIINGKLYIE